MRVVITTTDGTAQEARPSPWLSVTACLPTTPGAVAVDTGDGALALNTAAAPG
ncbi:hypothetical protein [Streptomyces sp. NPDC005547]|uniref:hypothetical protein n=1 Tax=Streptomyces sp. NPDC005547 TaxID=3154887 RepID=UPI0033B3083A